MVQPAYPREPVEQMNREVTPSVSTRIALGGLTTPADQAGFFGGGAAKTTSDERGRVNQVLQAPSRGESSNPVADAAMQRYSRGDASAFAELYDALAPRLYAFAFRKTRSPIRAEDLVQQTMLHVHCARARFVPGSRVTPWVYAIATRLFLDQVRRKKIEVLVAEGEETDHASERPGPDIFAEARELETLVRAEVDRLPAPQREAFELVVYAEMSNAEVAEMLGVSIPSVKMRLQRANAAIRCGLGRKDQNV